MLTKQGMPSKIKIVKTSFKMDANMLAQMIKDQWPDKSISTSQIHESLKSIGILEYSSDDMDNLISLLSGVGFVVKHD